MSNWKNRIVGAFFEVTPEADPETLPEPLASEKPTSKGPSKSTASTVGARRAPAPSRPVAAQPPPVVEVPAEIRQLIDQQFDDAASPALSAWSDMNSDLESDIADPVARARVAFRTIYKMGHTPEAVFTDIRECREKLDKMLAELEKVRDFELNAKVVSVENRANELVAEAERLEAEAQKKRADADQMIRQAAISHEDITSNHAGSIAYITALGENLNATEAEIRVVASPGQG